MSWILIAICAHFAWALVNIGDKYVVGNKVKNPYVYMVWLSMIGFLAVLLIPFVEFYIPDAEIIGWLALASAFYFYGGLPYIKAVRIEEISRINIWWQLIPIFSFGIAWFALDERLSMIHVGAMLVLIVGGGLASLHIKKRRIVISKALGLMIVACMAFSIYAVILHYLTMTMPFIVAFIWVSIFIGLFSLTPLLLSSFKNNFLEDSKCAIIGDWWWAVLVVSLLDSVGIALNLWALSLGPVVLVYAMEGFQVLFVFVLAVLITFKNKELLREELDRKNIILKLAAVALMIAGVIIINLG